ncbi:MULTISPECIES: chemotaxis protein [Desulfovibrio]|uniref:Two-component system, chemotaxis family, response regulator CheV n=2 Tax=Desulfovibrio desulfuricans TaxID=876 RepID=A0AA94HT21_DESDE|nr:MULTISPECIES: chemotaxis protein [Desulfovibrio]ATD80127.1 chemotaxis protein CheV [Desulfovibrio sp. G11]MDY0203543.1 chemotaxis protein [Desulfovibrio desulfuricans]SFW50749.1 two-component system, chemotaxis family, response regulator CheV [Desulfovibrio desulfuricans]SPD35581.1 CheY-like superfamily [Desulfovibrio sp. G11]
MAQTNILLETGTNELEIVEFYVNQDGYEAHYGLNVAKVVEIGRRQPVTAMPEMRHKALLGAFLHRNGRIVPLIDMACFLGNAPITNEDAKVIVTEFNGVCTGFLVSGVNRIYRLSWTDVEAPGQFLQNMSRSSVTGVVRLEERVIFLLDLEAIVAELHPAMALRFDASDMAAPDGKTYKILHVDDSSSIRSLLLDLLNKEGRFKVEQRVNGQEAWDYLQSVRNRCEAENRPVSDFLQGIITDIEMPAMDGLALCKRIKEDPVLKKLPVAIFSSMINDSLARKCALVGADAQYTKPDLKALSKKLYELITVAWEQQNATAKS